MGENLEEKSVDVEAPLGPQPAGIPFEIVVGGVGLRILGAESVRAWRRLAQHGNPMCERVGKNFCETACDVVGIREVPLARYEEERGVLR